MYNLLKTNEPSSSTRTLRFPRIDYIRKRVNVAHGVILDHYRSRCASVNSKHNIVLLSILLRNRFMSSGISLEDPEIGFFLEEVCNEAATLYGFHSKYKDGTLLQETFFKDTMEYIYLDYDNIDFVTLHEDWRNIDIVNHQAHPSIDFSLIPHGPNRNINGGISCTNINVYNLLVSIVKFYEHNAQSQDPMTIMQFVGSHIMINDLLGFMDVSFFNHYGKIQLTKSDLEFNQIPSVVVPDFMSYMTETINTINERLSDTRTRFNFEDILDQFVLIKENNPRESFCGNYKLNNALSYKRFWYRYHRLISFLCKYASKQNDPGRYNNHLNDLKRLISRSEGLGAFNGQTDLREYIEREIEQYI